jgi:hypothetical protein
VELVDALEVRGLRQQHQVGVAARADQRERPQQALAREVFAGGQELALVARALGVVEPPPGGVDLQEGVLDEVAFGHCASQSIGTVMLACGADRFEVISSRRLPAAAALLLMVLLLVRRPGVAALTALWAPATTLLAGALAPSLPVELAIVGPGSAALALLTERLLPWPRAAALPALAGVTAYALDVVLGSDLTVRSLLGPNPALGARFYGVGNELEAILPMLALIGVAAAAPRRIAVWFAVVMTVLAVVVGAGRFGADAGGVVTVAVAGTVATLWPLRGRRKLALAAAAPVAAIAALAAIDLATGAHSHFRQTVLNKPGDILHVLGHRYALAWDSLVHGWMPLATLAALAVAVWGIRRHAAFVHFPAWRAALAGGMAGAVAGALANDSGPLLFVLGVAVLTAAGAYLMTGDSRTEAVQTGL